MNERNETVETVKKAVREKRNISTNDNDNDNDNNMYACIPRTSLSYTIS
jgi:hypothetical protein